MANRNRNKTAPEVKPVTAAIEQPVTAAEVATDRAVQEAEKAAQDARDPEPAKIVDPVECVICKRTVERASTMNIPRNGYNEYFCKGESAKSGCKAPKPSAEELAKKAADAKAAAEARKAEKDAKKSAKKTAAPATAIQYTAPVLEGEAKAAFDKSARQLKIIVNLIANAPERTMTKKAVCETLDALNGRGDTATDLATRQTALAILMHYQKVMTDAGFLVQSAVPVAAPAPAPAPRDRARR